MKTNEEIVEQIIADTKCIIDGDTELLMRDAAFEMAQIKDRQFAEKIKAKAYKMYALSQGGGSYDDRADALTIYGFLADFYHDLTGESL